VPGPHTPGRLPHCYRGDNITLIARPAPMPPRLLLKSSGLRSGVGRPMGLSVRGKNSYAPEKRSGRGHRHQVEYTQMADTVSEAQKSNGILEYDSPFIFCQEFFLKDRDRQCVVILINFEASITTSATWSISITPESLSVSCLRCPGTPPVIAAWLCVMRWV
jgi:hypothetical protein